MLHCWKDWLSRISNKTFSTKFPPKIAPQWSLRQYPTFPKCKISSSLLLPSNKRRLCWRGSLWDANCAAQEEVLKLHKLQRATSKHCTEEQKSGKCTLFQIGERCGVWYLSRKQMRMVVGELIRGCRANSRFNAAPLFGKEDYQLGRQREINWEVRANLKFLFYHKSHLHTWDYLYYCIKSWLVIGKGSRKTSSIVQLDRRIKTL